MSNYNKYYHITGVGESIELGKNGTVLDDTGSTLAVKDSTDTLTNIEAADAVASNDLVTLQQLQAVNDSGNVKAFILNHIFLAGNSTPVPIGTVPLGGVIDEILVCVTDPDDTANIEISNSGNNDILFDSAYIVADEVSNSYNKMLYTSESIIPMQVICGSHTTDVALSVVVKYIVP